MSEVAHEKASNVNRQNRRETLKWQHGMGDCGNVSRSAADGRVLDQGNSPCPGISEFNQKYAVFLPWLEKSLKAIGCSMKAK
jgi:hypothetical protein